MPGIRGGAFGLVTALRAGMSRVRVTDGVTGILDLILSAALWPWGQPLPKMSIRNLLGGKGDRGAGLTSPPS
jgi:hypothetical protein